MNAIKRIVLECVLEKQINTIVTFQDDDVSDTRLCCILYPTGTCILWWQSKIKMSFSTSCDKVSAQHDTYQLHIVDLILCEQCSDSIVPTHWACLHCCVSKANVMHLLLVNSITYSAV